MTERQEEIGSTLPADLDTLPRLRGFRLRGIEMTRLETFIDAAFAFAISMLVIASQQIPDVPYHRFAELIGLKGIFVDRPNAVGAAWDEALAADRPVVLEFKTDPEVPPLPPHITLKQAKNFAHALLKGDPNEGSVIRGTARQLLSKLFPGRRRHDGG